MADNYDDLEAKARAAIRADEVTGVPTGAWTYNPHGVVTDDFGWVAAARLEHAAYIAAVHPQRILTLLADNRRLAAERGEAEADKAGLREKLHEYGVYIESQGARLAVVAAERDALRAETRTLRSTLITDAHAAQKAAEQQLAEVRGALRLYGHHGSHCGWRWDKPCTCGLDAALASAKGEEVANG